MKKILTILALSLTTIVSVGCMGKDTEIDVEEIETSTSTETTTSVTETSTTAGTSTTIDTTTTTTDGTTTTNGTTSTTNTTSIIETLLTDGTGEAIAAATTVSNSVCDRPCERTQVNKDNEEFIGPTQYGSCIAETSTTTNTTVITTTTATNQFLSNANNIVEVSSPKTSVIEVVDAPETQPEMQEEPQVETLKVKISAIGVEKLGNFRITGYCNDPMTASGKVPTVNHTIAMNNKQRKELGLEYGQQLYVTGDSIEGVFTLEDCGCGWNVVDVYCTNEAECCKITSYADVYIVVN